jgi:CxxC motif-containing protein (DUF1111 family)
MVLPLIVSWPKLGMAPPCEIDPEHPTARLPVTLRHSAIVEDATAAIVIPRLIGKNSAYKVEQGVTNGIPNERNTTSGCVFNATPEDSSNLLNGPRASPNFGTTVGTLPEMSSDVVNFAFFVRLTGAADPAPPNSSITNGQSWLSQIGCNLCHSPNLTTAAPCFTAMSNVTYHPCSDLALHHMGARLADGINYGAAGADQFPYGSVVRLGAAAPFPA